MDDHPYGFWSLAPPVVAIVLSIATRHVIASLMLGVLCGSMILHQGNWAAAIVDAAETRLWSSLVNEELLRVFTFTLLMGAMVWVVNRCGGMHGVVRLLSVFATNRRRGKILVWILGLVVFFDDYANTLLLGTTMRPLTDRLRISR